ncbi:hypothetical protein LguiA_010530 [Lonicera macranthoides]
MSISVNGQSKVPPGFRFHPTEEELLQYYLRKKVSHQHIDLEVIKDVDLNKLEPWDIQGFWKATGRDKAIYSSNGRARIGMRKTLVFYKGRAPHGLKSDYIMHEYRLLDDDDNSNTTTDDAYNNISGGACGGEVMNKTVSVAPWTSGGGTVVAWSDCAMAVWRSGVAEELVELWCRNKRKKWEPESERSEKLSESCESVSCAMKDSLQPDEGWTWVVCRIFKKKNHIIKSLEDPITTVASSIITTTTETTTQMLINSNISNDEGTLEQIINMGKKTYEAENDANNIKRLLNINPMIIVDSTLTINNNDDDKNNNIVSLRDKVIKHPNLDSTDAVYNSSEIGLSNWVRLDDYPMMMEFGSLNYNDDLQFNQLPLSSPSSSSSSIFLPNYTHYAQATLDYFSSQTDYLWSFTQ